MKSYFVFIVLKSNPSASSGQACYNKTMTIDNEYFKNKLEGERKILIQELKNLGILNPKTGDWEATPDKSDIGFAEADEIDRADHSEDFQERTSTLNTLEIRLKEIERALEKIKKDKYGKCEICSTEIEGDRLEANSAASTCKAHMR